VTIGSSAYFFADDQLHDSGPLTALAQLPSGGQMELILDLSGYFAP
jgi:hypothetical protein